MSCHSDRYGLSAGPAVDQPGLRPRWSHSAGVKHQWPPFLDLHLWNHSLAFHRGGVFLFCKTSLTPTSYCREVSAKPGLLCKWWELSTLATKIINVCRVRTWQQKREAIPKWSPFCSFFFPGQHGSNEAWQSQPNTAFGKAAISLSSDSLWVLCQEQNRPQ